MRSKYAPTVLHKSRVVKHGGLMWRTLTDLGYETLTIDCNGMALMWYSKGI